MLDTEGRATACSAMIRISGKSTTTCSAGTRSEDVVEAGSATSGRPTLQFERQCNSGLDAILGDGSIILSHNSGDYGLTVATTTSVARLYDKPPGSGVRQDFGNGLLCGIA